MAERPKTRIVLVHGVWIDGSCWAEVIRRLNEKGYEAHAVQLPLTSFDEDVATTLRVIHHVGGPVVLVGQSYGGAVISAAGTDPQVKNLVYITALAPDAQQPIGALMGMNPPAAKVQIVPDADGFVWVDAPTFSDAIAHDVAPNAVEIAVAVQKPYAAKLFGASVADPAWQHKPSWYLVTTEDRILSPITQRAMAKKIGAKVHEVATSHLPLLANPQAVVNIILEATA